ncbi:glycosyltransferase family 4 protein [Brevibacillus sp. B_LB10_24]|uniref:glycosyltransferase family 4 protein n=1 Tax=Brevibacillus sp. B_LB10_24 TaxID=3380645 RepID=UPI0038B76D91
MKYTGVYWLGPVYDMGGYGNVSRNFLRAFESIGIPVFIHSIGPEHQEIGESTIKWIKNLSSNQIGDRVVFIRHGLAELFQVSFAVPHVVKNIGVTLFETDRLPEGWASFANLMDEVWVPSRFNYDTFSKSGVSPEKLKVVPYGIDVTKYSPGRPCKKLAFPSSVNSFVFLYVFGFDYRKGYDLLIKAFCDEFSPAEDVSLLLKVYTHSDIDPEFALSEIQSHIPPERCPSQIAIIPEPYSEEDLIALYQNCDVYISMDRAAGWGMPVMEAMALGKPVIALRWGGSTEFMNETNSFLIETEEALVPVDAKLQAARPRYYLHHQWADVKIEKVRQVMREAYVNKKRREQLAKKAAADIHQYYSPARIGTIIKKLLS